MESKFKIGDRVYISGGEYGNSIAKIISKTKTGNFKTKNDIIYPDGKIRGCSIWRRRRAEILTTELETAFYNRIFRNRFVVKMEIIDWAKYSIEDMKKILEILDKKS